MYSGSVFYDFSLIFSQITGVELVILALLGDQLVVAAALRSEEHTSELQSR